MLVLNQGALLGNTRSISLRCIATYTLPGVSVSSEYAFTWSCSRSVFCGVARKPRPVWLKVFLIQASSCLGEFGSQCSCASSKFGTETRKRSFSVLQQDIQKHSQNSEEGLQNPKNFERGEGPRTYSGLNCVQGQLSLEESAYPCSMIRGRRVPASRKSR